MNPMQIIQMMAGNRNPMQMIQNNPMAINAMQMMQNNDVQGLKKMAENLCKEKGLNINDVESQIRQRFGIR